MRNNDYQTSVLAGFIIRFLYAINKIIIDANNIVIDAIISMDSFLWPLWTALALSVDETFHNAPAFFSCSSNQKTTSTGPASQLSTIINKTLQWIEPFLLPTPTSQEDTTITEESLEFLESRIDYLHNFFDATIAAMTITNPRSPKRDPSTGPSFINSSTPVRHTPVRSQVDPVAKTCAPGRYSVVFYEHSSGNADHAKKVLMVWHMPHPMDNMMGEASGVAQAVQVAGNLQEVVLQNKAPRPPLPSTS
ncbi:hypothetical protein B0H65DRAFT_312323 [Neurospora tetraspora]|uniref:Uncharacterized protein n=1 Tax=Neurospora tetraspora TaxID=94610 RepID=A0AAE0J714_9PEZI|nr:hypothetical protein B0H65DRAFT_312323 [Neurospora tetraspora]